MRILYIGNWIRRGRFSSDEFKVARALEAEGHTVIRAAFSPGHVVVPTEPIDFVLWSKCARATPAEVEAWRRALPVPHVQWFWDSVWQRLHFFWASAHLMDVIFHNEEGLFEPYGRKTPNTKWVYLDSACDPDYHVPAARARNDWRCDVGFIGTAYAAGGRLELLGRLAKRFAVHSWSTRPDRWRASGVRGLPAVFGPDIAVACASSAIQIGCSMKCWTAGSWSNRLYTVVASGGFLLTQHVPGLDRIVTPGVHVATYTDFDDCERQVEHWFERPEDRQRIAARGCMHLRLHHTWRHRVRLLVGEVARLL
jgi:glycosyl transferase family 1